MFFLPAFPWQNVSILEGWSTWIWSQGRKRSDGGLEFVGDNESTSCQVVGIQYLHVMEEFETKEGTVNNPRK